ncbi:SDR family oxidoreductase [Microbacterium murale]|uniref:3-oxoacyl-[acyl-carrier protein] reductase n=1 Tax=Microbacterium murale TaxID=1081040 RepID=A0ABU0P4Q4_9MICO|nr:SDR family oxidoreductase [Microbacterium murale]MDQ0642313.1 3-oxoacyl-[acyl-carrier protein] reductase [Microbacterium murale]
MGGLDGKTALVTGGSRGIGRAISERLAADGALVAVHGRDADSGRDVVAAITSAGGRAFTVGADLSAPSGTDVLFAQLDAELRERTGSTGLDILVANAGVAGAGSLASTSAEWFDELFAVNTRSVFFLLQQAQNRLADGGRVVTMSTGLTKRADPDLLAYSMSKAALDTMILGAAKDLGSRGITVNAVAPGVIDTDMNAGWLRTSTDARDAVSAMSPFNRIGTPPDVADVVAFLVSNDARWVTGQYLDATGGALL